MPTLKNPITKEDEDFIREHYLKMHDSQIIKHLKPSNERISSYFLQQFRIENKLMKKNPNRAKVIRFKGKYFNVNARENWVM